MPDGVLAALERLRDLVQKYSDDQPRDEAGRWTSGGSGGEQPTPQAMTVMERYQGEQAWDGPIREYMEANGLTLDDYKTANEALRSHNISSGEASDRRLSDLWNSGSSAGRALQLMAAWQEWQVQHELNPSELSFDSIRNSLRSAEEDGSVRDWLSMREGGAQAGTADRYRLYLDKLEKGERVYFRKGGLDHAALSTTTDVHGAISGSSSIRPDRFFTFDELKGAGYHLVSGARGVVGVVSAQENEYIWLKPLPRRTS